MTLILSPVKLYAEMYPLISNSRHTFKFTAQISLIVLIYSLLIRDFKRFILYVYLHRSDTLL